MKKFFRFQPKQNNEPTIEDDFFFLGIIGCIAIAAVLLLFRWLPLRFRMPPCLFHRISGYYCPGCGGTRALLALLHGQLLRSAWYHPFVPYAAFIFLYFMITQAAERLSSKRLRIGMRYQNRFVWIGVALIIGNFICKNLLRYFYGFQL
ncbi:MAG: DUF2752 domain-containing protein [Eubacterium sp.]|nr:DUF2752 domain-containing protein [Eubacterium sp.]